MDSKKIPNNILYDKFILYQLCQALLYLMQCTLQSSQNRGAWCFKKLVKETPGWKGFNVKVKMDPSIKGTHHHV